MHLEFARPDLLDLLLLLPIWWLLLWPRAGRGVLFARGESASRIAGGWRPRSTIVVMLPRVLRSAAMACLVVALADPQRIEVIEERSLQGRGIGLAIDLSSSMLAMDMEDGSSRIAVARDAAIRFAEGRPHDELSLVGFAGQAITRVPPTTDANLVVAGIESLEDQLVRDGTDISAAVLTSVARLLDSEREPRAVILLTDGAHNGIGVRPLAAARAAAALGVKVHAISILGPADTAATPAALRSRILQRQRQVVTDMRTVLEGISGLTGGKYFHAASATALDSIYREIDRIEAPVERVTTREVRHSVRAWALLLGFLFLGVDALLRGSRWSVVP